MLLVRPAGLCSGWPARFSARTLHPHKRRCVSSSSSPDSPSKLRILFFGADSFSCDVFTELHNARADLVDSLTVVTPPDQRTGRRLKEVHRQELGVPAIALPQTLLKDWQPPEPFLPASPSAPPSPQNLLLTASFGHLLPTPLLSLFHPLNALNVHPSLLPRWRGAAPIQRGIIAGDADGLTDEPMGVTVQELSRGRFDRGRILAQQAVDAPPHASFPTLEPILARAGGALLVSVLRTLEAHQARARPQGEEGACLAPKLGKESARVHWNAVEAREVCRLQRGVGHQYPLWTTYHETQLQLRLSALPVPLPPALSSAAPGTVALNPATKTLILRCADAHEGVQLEEVKKEGGKWVKAREWWNGAAGGGKKGPVVFE
ncbi:Methionyl-tRNA formyltransferase [Rhodotorula kratochvilovae]